ncbi:MAG: MipA/OmpV family protein, partial [Pseudoalteromonas sp.]
MTLNINTLTALCVSLWFASPCFAQQSEIDPVQNITIDQWHLSLNLGLGVMSNPLKGGDDLPLVVIPEVAYYGEQFFFDNGRLGYSLSQDTPHIFNLVSEFNPETRFFVDWHPSNIFALTSANSLSTSNNELQSQQPRLDIEQLDKRKWALDAGMSYHYVFKQHVFSVQALADVSGVYEGWRSALQWQMHNNIG